jgi:hypothetical protein
LNGRRPHAEHLLALTMTGKIYEVFTDAAHVTNDRKTFKAEQIGQFILEHQS